MTDVDFYTDVLANGTVRGVGLSTAPGRWEDALGAEYIDDVAKSRSSMRRDFGLIELGFIRTGGEWLCSAITLQVHRLAVAPVERIVPAMLREEYGPFSRSIGYDDFRVGVEHRGVELEKIADTSKGSSERYWVATSRAIVHVEEGDVWSVNLSLDADAWRAR